MLVTDKQCIVLNTPSCNLISLYFLNSFILDGSLFALLVGRREEHPSDEVFVWLSPGARFRLFAYGLVVHSAVRCKHAVI